MPGCWRQPGISRALAGSCGGNWPITAKRSGYFFAAAIASAPESGSQLAGGWMSAASTPASSISFRSSSAVNFATLRCAPVGGFIVWPQIWTCASMIFMGLSSVGGGSIGLEQFLALELAPEIGRDLDLHAFDVLSHLARAERSGDHRAECGVEQRELQRCGTQLDAMAPADRLDLL